MSEIRSQATPARDELAEKVFDLLVAAEAMGEQRRNVIAHGIAMGLEDAGWSKPRTVNSIEEAEALPDGSAIITDGEVAIALTDCTLPVRIWDTGDGVQCTSHFLALPVTVLFTPGDAG